jgi:two-component system, cell cycle sensor histidine kinase and response regulator CckA
MTPPDITPPDAKRAAASAKHKSSPSDAQEAEERFRLLVEGVTDYAIFMLDPDGHISSWNAGAARIKGYRADEIVGRHFSVFYPPEEVEADKPGRELVIARAEGKYEEEGWRVRKDGSRFWANVLITALRDEQGRLRGFAKVTRDMTERREAEARLQRHEALLTAVLETLPVGVLVIDPEGRLLLHNSAATSIWGPLQEGAELYGLLESRRAQWLDSRQLVDSEAWPIRQAVRQGRSLRNLAVAVEGDRGGRVVLMSAAPLRDAQGNIVGGVSVDQDITERHETEAQLQQAREHLVQAHKMEAVGRLAGGIAHDFNNLLTLIIGSSTLALRGLPADHRLRTALEDIHTAGERAAGLTRQLLAFSRRQVLQPEVLDLNAIVLGVSRMLRRLIGEDVAIRLDLAPSLGKVQADRTQIEQVIVNLALNARDAMPHGGTLILGTEDVTVGQHKQGEELGLAAGPYVMLAVSDTGVGMDAVTRAHIFEPFFTTKRTGEGTGLGLATAYGIVQQSGGAIQVESEAGKGSCFRVYLPSAVDQDTTDPEAAVEPMGGSEVILIVEDEPGLRRFTANLLREYGYEVYEAANGDEALHVARSAAKRIDLVLTDVVMPGMSGPELAEQLAGHGMTTRVLFMSGYTDAGTARSRLAAALPLLQKPFTPESLAGKVRELLDAPPSS